MAAVMQALGQQGPSKQGSSADRSLRSVFVGNIPYEASEEQLKDIFSEVGPVVSFRLVFDRETGKPKGYGFCEYKDQETALSAMRNLNGRELNGRALRVDSAASEKDKEEMKGMEGPGRPEVSPYGPPVAPDEAPEAITQAVASLPPEQMFELMKQMKICIQNNPEEARQMLLQNPQLAYALLQAQVVMKIVDPVIAQNLLHRNEPVAPLQTGAPPQNPTGAPGPGPMAGGPVPMNQGPPGQFQGPGPEMRPDMRGPQDQWGSMGPDSRGPDQRGPQDMRGLPPDRGPGGMHGPPDRGPGGVHGPPDRGPGRMHGPPDRGPGGMHGPPDRGPGGMHGPPDRGPGGMHGPPDRDFRGPPQDQGFGDPRDRRMYDHRDPRSRDPPRDDRRGGMDHRDHPRDPRGGPPEQRPGGPRFGPAGPRDPRGDRGPMPSDGRFQGPGHSPQHQWGHSQGGPPSGGPSPAGFNAPTSGGPGGDVTAQDQEKAALIMQVLSLTDQQIALLPEDQRQSIMVLKEQIARSAT